MSGLIMLACFVVGAYHFFGPLGIIVVGVLLLLKKK